MPSPPELGNRRHGGEFSDGPCLSGFCPGAGRFGGASRCGGRFLGDLEQPRPACATFHCRHGPPPANTGIHSTSAPNYAVRREWSRPPGRLAGSDGARAVELDSSARIDEAAFRGHLQTSGEWIRIFADPPTSGGIQGISNFLLWQLPTHGNHITDVCSGPIQRAALFAGLLLDFRNRQRRFGVHQPRALRRSLPPTSPFPRPRLESPPSAPSPAPGCQLPL